MKKFGTIIFGGAFNPPTIAHVLNVKYLVDSLEFENFIVMPTGNPPHKDLECLDDETRLELAKIVFGEIDGVEVSDYEFRQAGESYTFKTLEHFKKTQEDLAILVGMDSFLSLPRWKNAEEILKLAKVIVMKRSGYEFAAHDLYEKYKDRFYFVDNPIFEMSSSFVRERLKAGKDVRFYVTDRAYEFLKGIDFKELCGCTN